MCSSVTKRRIDNPFAVLDSRLKSNRWKCNNGSFARAPSGGILGSKLNEGKKPSMSNFQGQAPVQSVAFRTTFTGMNLPKLC